MVINLATIDFCPGQGGGVNPSGTLDITSNGEYDVYSYASASVSVHPSSSLSETYTTNGTKTITGEFNGGTVNVDVHPSNVFSGSYSSNGIYNISGEFNGGEITVEVPVPQFITETLNVSANNTYYPGIGVNGFSEVIVNVPQSVTGYTEKEITEGVQISNLNNSASSVHPFVFEKDTYLQTVSLPNCTSVGELAFADCQNLTDVYLPNCITFGSSVFNRCYNLQNVNIDNCTVLIGGVFGDCSKISEISLPNCIQLSGNVFGNCKSLSNISLPKCTSLQGQVFYNCSTLSEISLPNCRYLSGNVFDGCSNLSDIYMPKCIILSGTGQIFKNCSSLSSSLDFPNVMYVGTSIFNGMSISEISLPKCKEVGGIAFQYCRSLSELNLPKCGYISGAAINDTNITKVNIPMAISFALWANRHPAVSNTSVNELYICTDVYGCPSYSMVVGNTTPLNSGQGSIYVNEQNYSYFISASGWSNISSIIYSVSADSNPLISGSDGLLYGSTRAVASNYSIYTSLNSGNLTSVSLPNCEYIAVDTFRSCRQLTGISLPNCEYIANNAFSDCINISEFSLPNCEYIANNAFKNCSNSAFTSLTLPKCKYIGGAAFDNCKNLSEIYFTGSDVCTIEQTTMWNTGLVGDILKFYVPTSLIDEYKSAMWWSSMSSRIFPIE